MMQKVYKILLKAVPEAARAQLDDLVLRSGPDEFAASPRAPASRAPAPAGELHDHEGFWYAIRTKTLRDHGKEPG